MNALLVAALVVAGLYFARDILIPFALAGLLSLLLIPVVRGLHRLHIGRLPAVAITFVAASLAILGFFAIAASEVSSLSQQLPWFERNIEEKVASLPHLLPGGRLLDHVAAALREMRGDLARSAAGNAEPAHPQAASPGPAVPVRVIPPATTPLDTILLVIGPLLGPLEMAGLVALFVLWMLLNHEDLRDRLLRLAGGDLHRTTAAMDDAASRVSRYLATQLAVNLGCGVPIGIGLAVIGIPYAALWAAIIVLLRFLPYLGIVIAASFPLALALAVDPGWNLVLWTALLIVGVETLVANLLEPRLYGATTGLSPIAVIAAVVFWTWLWGAVGLLLAMPLTVCLVVLGRHVPQLGFLGVLLGNEPALSPEETFYQRLLANDPEEATEQAEEFAKSASLEEFFDTVAIPALAMAQADRDRGVLSPERRTVVARGITAMLEHLADDLPTARAGHPCRVACVAGRNDLDYAAAEMLAELARRHGCETVEALSADALSTQPGNRFEDAELLVLSLVSTDSRARARYLVRRLRRQAPRARIAVGFWGAKSRLPDQGAADAIAADAVFGSLREALAAMPSEESPEPAVVGASR